MEIETTLIQNTKNKQVIQYITNIEIENFKILKNINTILSKDINILIGKNGLGKTSFLQAITLALLPLNNVDKSNEFEKYINFDSPFAKILINLNNEQKTVFVYQNHLQITDNKYFTNKIILAYGVNINTDLHLDHSRIVTKLIAGNALPYYTKSMFRDYSIDFFDPIFLLLTLTKENYRGKNKEIKKIILLIKNTINNYLDLFSESERISLQGGEYADFHYIDINNTKLQTEHLSEGYKDYILQITDIIVRIIASRNSLFQNQKIEISEKLFKQTQGVIIIDEFDRHLHPELQRKFLLKLKKDFPKIQFILSTHNIFSLQSAEGFTALILENENKSLKITNQEITNGLSLESIYSIYFNGKTFVFGNKTEQILNQFYNLLYKYKIENLDEKEFKNFKRIIYELLAYSDEVNGIITREIRQLERQTGKNLNI